MYTAETLGKITCHIKCTLTRDIAGFVMPRNRTPIKIHGLRSHRANTRSAEKTKTAHVEGWLHEWCVRSRYTYRRHQSERRCQETCQHGPQLRSYSAIVVSDGTATRYVTNFTSVESGIVRGDRKNARRGYDVPSPICFSRELSLSQRALC